MLIDQILPTADVARVDVVVVNGAPEEVYRALLDYDLADLPRDDRLVGALFALRSIPDRVVRILGERSEQAPVTSLRLAELPSEGAWVKLGENPGHEVVFGAAGRFWNGPIRWERITTERFASFAVPDSARIAASMAVHPYSPGRVLLSYETRVLATDDRARRGLTRYWRFLAPFIGMVLRGVLRAVEKRVETGGGTSTGSPRS